MSADNPHPVEILPPAVPDALASLAVGQRRMEGDARAAALALALTPRLGPILLSRLLQQFHDVQPIFSAGKGELQQVPGIATQMSRAIQAADPAAAERLLRRCARDGIKVLLWGDSDYPLALYGLPDLPLVLFVYGSLPTPATPGVAIVGTRQAGVEGAAAARWWAQEFAMRGWAVVSGLARGIDTHAHRSALEAKGCSMAVLGSGLNRVYPPENSALAAWLTHKGALVSEVHPDSGVTRSALVLRNRLITAFSRAVIVVECSEDSGAMDAARRAHAQGKPIYVPRMPTSAGTTALLESHIARPLPTTTDELIAELS